MVLLETLLARTVCALLMPEFIRSSNAQMQCPGITLINQLINFSTCLKMAESGIELSEMEHHDRGTSRTKWLKKTTKI